MSSTTNAFQDFFTSFKINKITKGVYEIFSKKVFNFATVPLLLTVKTFTSNYLLLSSLTFNLFLLARVPFSCILVFLSMRQRLVQSQPQKHQILSYSQKLRISNLVNWHVSTFNLVLLLSTLTKTSCSCWVKGPIWTLVPKPGNWRNSWNSNNKLP